VTQSKRSTWSIGEPEAWWQTVFASEPVPKGSLITKSKCDGTIEDHRNVALDVRELIRKHVFERPVARFLVSSCAFLGCA
jgi:hypothetical protein